MNNSNLKKQKQLKIAFGTANNRLRKEILFKYVQKAGENFCYRCAAEITSCEDFSIEHKIPYLDSLDPIALFFDLDNIAFSHLSCNIKAGRRNFAECGVKGKYNKGCRCDLCTEANTKHKRKQRKKLKMAI